MEGTPLLRLFCLDLASLATLCRGLEQSMLSLKKRLSLSGERMIISSGCSMDIDSPQ